jgi:2'-5' RNA ligase
MRLFFALWPPRAASEALHRWASAVRRETGGRLTRLETIHLTLAFLGDVDELVLPLLQEFRLKGESHTLPINCAHYWKHNQIVWIGPEEIPDELREIVSSLEYFLKEHRFRTEEREFAAHITLIRKARPPKALPPLPEISWPVEEVLLVRSHLSSRGSSYEVLQRYPLS